MELAHDDTYVVAIDYDGTLYRNGSIVQDAFEFIAWAHEQGIYVVLWTCREGRLLQSALDTLDEAGIVLDGVNQGNGRRPDSRKINANLYIDDQANCGIDWDDIKVRIEKEMRGI